MKRWSIVLVFCLLVGCGDQTLVVRSTLEGDNYLRNNVNTLSNEQFESLFASNADIEDTALSQLNDVLSTYGPTRYILVEDRIYRFSADNRLLYVADWHQENDAFVLSQLTFP